MKPGMPVKESSCFKVIRTKRALPTQHSQTKGINRSSDRHSRGARTSFSSAFVANEKGVPGYTFDVNRHWSWKTSVEIRSHRHADSHWLSMVLVILFHSTTKRSISFVKFGRVSKESRINYSRVDDVFSKVVSATKVPISLLFYEATAHGTWF